MTWRLLAALLTSLSSRIMPWRLADELTYFAPDAGGGDGGGGEGSGGDGGGDGGGNGGSGTLEADARAAIDALKAAGAEIPAALTKAVDELAGARRDAAKYRTNGNETATKVANLEAQFAKLATHLGIEDTDPESVAKAATEERDRLAAEVKQMKLVGAIGTVAAKEKADAVALADSRTFMEAVSKLDPAADDFTSTLEAEVKKAIEANPKLKATQAVGKSGTEHNGNGSSEKPKTLMDAVVAAYAD